MQNKCNQISRVNLSEKITNITAGAYFSIAHSSQGLWIWGRYSKQILGTQHFEQQSHQSYSVDPLYLNIKANDSSAGFKHSFAWSEDKVFCWGSNNEYQLALSEQRQYKLTTSTIFEEAIQAGIKIKQISCGDSHTLAILEVSQDQGDNETHETQLYSWGQSKNYQLALDTTAIIPYPVQVEMEPLEIKKVYSRSDYNILLSEQGNCYSWGSNIFGRLGALGIKHHKVPTIINIPIKIRQISIGLYHCVVVTFTEEGYSWGHGMQGQLGINQIVSQAQPTKMLLDLPIRTISCGEYHTVVVSTNNNIFTCGSNANGALGHEDVDTKKRCRKLSKISFQIKQQICAVMSGNRHNLILTIDGEVYSWGCNKFGQLGYSTDKPFPTKQNIKNNYLLLPNKQNNFLQQKYQNQNPTNLISKKQQSKQQKLLNWKQRYQIFKQQKMKQQQQFMKQLQHILTNQQQQQM